MQRATLIDGTVAAAGVTIAPLWWFDWIEGGAVSAAALLTVGVGIIRLRIALMDLRERRRQSVKRMKGDSARADVRANGENR